MHDDRSTASCRGARGEAARAAPVQTRVVVGSSTKCAAANDVVHAMSSTVPSMIELPCLLRLACEAAAPIRPTSLADHSSVHDPCRARAFDLRLIQNQIRSLLADGIHTCTAARAHGRIMEHTRQLLIAARRQRREQVTRGPGMHDAASDGDAFGALHWHHVAELNPQRTYIGRRSRVMHALHTHMHHACRLAERRALGGATGDPLYYCRASHLDRSARPRRISTQPRRPKPTSSLSPSLSLSRAPNRGGNESVRTEYRI